MPVVAAFSHEEEHGYVQNRADWADDVGPVDINHWPNLDVEDE